MTKKQTEEFKELIAAYIKENLILSDRTDWDGQQKVLLILEGEVLGEVYIDNK